MIEMRKNIFYHLATTENVESKTTNTSAIFMGESKTRHDDESNVWRYKKQASKFWCYQDFFFKRHLDRHGAIIVSPKAKMIAFVKCLFFVLSRVGGFV